MTCSDVTPTLDPEKSVLVFVSNTVVIVLLGIRQCAVMFPKTIEEQKVKSYSWSYRIYIFGSTLYLRPPTITGGHSK